jgi:hypothetical protein
MNETEDWNGQPLSTCIGYGSERTLRNRIRFRTCRPKVSQLINYFTESSFPASSIPAVRRVLERHIPQSRDMTPSKGPHSFRVSRPYGFGKWGSHTLKALGLVRLGQMDPLRTGKVSFYTNEIPYWGTPTFTRIQGLRLNELPIRGYGYGYRLPLEPSSPARTLSSFKFSQSFWQLFISPCRLLLIQDLTAPRPLSSYEAYLINSLNPSLRTGCRMSFLNH